MHLLNELQQVPEKLAWTLKHSNNIKKLAEKYKDARDFLYLGRGYNFPVALEGR
jgi:glucosamine--fructose-6-phosphate aminotransferase (isomerizing)